MHLEIFNQAKLSINDRKFILSQTLLDFGLVNIGDQWQLLPADVIGFIVLRCGLMYLTSN